MMQDKIRLLIVEDDLRVSAELRHEAERLGLTVEELSDPAWVRDKVASWKPSIIAMDLVMPGTDGLELIGIIAEQKYSGHLILMSGGFELYLKMAEEMANARGLRVAATLTKPLRPKQFSYLLMTLI
jgi:DNA-binding response OmpR family regulator